MLEKADLIGQKYTWFSFFTVDAYPLSLSVSTEMPQAAAWFCASKNGLTNTTFITSLFYTHNVSLVKKTT